MSQSTILTLLPQTPYNNDGTGNAYSVTGNSVQAAGYILGGQDLQTLTYNFSEVTGNLIIEGTLASTPMASGPTAFSNQYIPFPEIPYTEPNLEI